MKRDFIQKKAPAVRIKQEPQKSCSATKPNSMSFGAQDSQKNKRPIGKKSAQPKKPYIATGYALFCSEMRSAVQMKNPEMTFGDISRVIGGQWRELTNDEQGIFKEKARIQNATAGNPTKVELKGQAAKVTKPVTVKSNLSNVLMENSDLDKMMAKVDLGNATTE